jgi:hypothetical protein
MHSQWVDGQASTLQQLPNTGPDEARDGTQNVVGDLRRRVSEAEVEERRKTAPPAPSISGENGTAWVS